MPQLKGPSLAFAGDTDAVDSSALNPVGTRALDADGNEYIYAPGVASVAVGSWVSFDDNLATTLLAANAKGRVGIAMAAIVADKYGWFQIYGKAVGKVLAGFVDGGLCYATATAGSVDDAVVAGDLVVGAVGRSAVASGVADIELSYPFITDTLG